MDLVIQLVTRKVQYSTYLAPADKEAHLVTSTSYRDIEQSTGNTAVGLFRRSTATRARVDPTIYGNHCMPRESRHHTRYILLGCVLVHVPSFIDIGSSRRRNSLCNSCTLLAVHTRPVVESKYLVTASRLCFVFFMCQVRQSAVSCEFDR